jgi:hypothetical protein
MLYALLAYHEEQDVQSWTDEEDAALMASLQKVHERLHSTGSLGPAARLGATAGARTVLGKALVVDGPFTETKEALLGFYVLDFETIDQAVEAALSFQAANPGARYEIRPIALYLPGTPIPRTDAGLEPVRVGRG